jgi:dolichol-phosphate mannosyltransferase
MLQATSGPAKVQGDPANAEVSVACQLSLVIPTRNERENVPLLLAKLGTVLDGLTYEIIIVDDSDDDTPQVATQVADELQVAISVIHREADGRLGGLSTAVLEGVAAASGGYICIMDGDLQHPPELIALMLDAAAECDADIVIASRYIEGGSDAGLSGRTRKVISLCSKSLVRTVFWRRLRKVTDPLSGFFIARRTLLHETALKPIGFKILLDILVRSHWKKVEELPLVFERRSGGSSKATIKQGRDFLRHVAGLFWEFNVARKQRAQPVAKPIPGEEAQL